jgi:hypothetical protein
MEKTKDKEEVNQCYPNTESAVFAFQSPTHFSRGAL